jgi:CheY-like chemotaxis protein
VISSLAGTSVLLADDDVDNLELIEFLFQDAGATVRAVRSAEEALALLPDWKPDVLLLDISMPNMDGYELLETIRRDHDGYCEIPAIAITGGAFERDKRRAEAAGFAVHVAKPFDVEALLHLVRGLVDKRPRPETALSVEFVRHLRDDGLHAALGFLNGQGTHRFTGIYRFDGDVLRNLHLFDRQSPAVLPTGNKGDDAPMAETYCSLVRAERTAFVTVDTEADPRLSSHPARLQVQSYCGALLRNADSTPFGTVCNFDLVPQLAPKAMVELLELVAPILSAEVAERA